MGWFELSDDERPPEWIWLDDEAVSEHFELLAARRKSSSSNFEEVPDADLTSNELTANLRR